MKKTKKITIAICSLIAVAGLAVGGWQAWKFFSTDDNAGGEQPPVTVESYLSAPKNVEVSLNALFSTKTFTYQTEQIIKWDYVTNATGFCVTIDDKDYYTTERTQQSYNITDKVQVGKTYEIKVKAIGDGVTYGDSEYTIITETIKEVPKTLVYTQLENGTYSVKKTSTDTVINGDLILPDTYEGVNITEIENKGFYEIHEYDSLAIREKGITSIRFPKYLTKIGNFAFSNCVKLKMVELPKSVIEYESSIFSYCISLSSAILPENMTKIPDCLFQECSSLKSIELPKNLTEIGDSAFAYTGLGSIEFPETVIEIGSSAFTGTKIKSVEMPKQLKVLQGFGATLLEEVKIPASIEIIGISAFFGCELLTKVEFEENSQLREIEASAFSALPLTEINLPDSVEIIGKNAFKDTKLTAFEFPENIKSIGDNVFLNTSLTSIEIPASITCIGESAFQDSHLSEVVLHEGLLEIGNYAFANTPLINIEIPASVTNIGYCVFAPIPSSSTTEIIGGKLEEIKVAQGNTSFKIMDGSLYTIDGKRLVSYLVTKTDKEYITLNDLEAIYPFAFAGATNLEEIIIGESVTSIGRNAFENCTSLKSLQLPDNEISIGTNFIKGCSSLVLVQIPIKAEVFVRNTPAKYIEFLDGRTEIVSQIWNNNEKPQIIVPKSVTKISGISTSEFFGMPMRLPVTFYYKGTADEWAEVELSNMGTTNITVYYYSETEPPLNEDGTAYDGNYWYYAEDGTPVVWVYVAQ